MKVKGHWIEKRDEDYLKMAAQATALAFEVDADAVLKRSRVQPLVFARQTAYWLMHNIMGYSYCETGRMFDRDHGGIMHGVKRVEEELAQDSTSKHDNGSWANQIRASKENFRRFYKVYKAVKPEEAKDVVETT